MLTYQRERKLKMSPKKLWFNALITWTIGVTGVWLVIGLTLPTFVIGLFASVFIEVCNWTLFGDYFMVNVPGEKKETK